MYIHSQNEWFAAFGRCTFHGGRGAGRKQGKWYTSFHYCYINTEIIIYFLDVDVMVIKDNSVMNREKKKESKRKRNR